RRSQLLRKMNISPIPLRRVESEDHQPPPESRILPIHLGTVVSHEEELGRSLEFRLVLVEPPTYHVLPAAQRLDQCGVEGSPPADLEGCDESLPLHPHQVRAHPSRVPHTVLREVLEL